MYTYNRILVPMDGSQPGEKALNHAIGIISTVNYPVQLTIMHVSHASIVNEPITEVEDNQSVDLEAELILGPAMSRLKEAKIPFEIFTEFGDPASGIIRAAYDANIDLIIMGTRGMGIMSELLLGSVSHQVVKEVSCPVFLVK
ncbi:universal stress protein [Paenibacillus sp. HB172176]|uniref:universal stress protein n=1 Tax=Paenibacillus sp. HB172176 TaxID=2493690 RepID=UPI00143C2322|nr:universal stress protein [Paenibacillus sp. HB172176]